MTSNDKAGRDCMMTADGDDAETLDDVFSSDRDRTGKSAPVEKAAPEAEVKPLEAEAQPEAEGEKPISSPGRDDKGRFVPLASVLEERKKLQERFDSETKLRAEAEKRLERYEAQVRHLERQMQARQPAEPQVDWLGNPEEAAAVMQQQFQAQILDQRAFNSEWWARDKFGDEMVEEALAAGEKAGVNMHFFINSEHPYRDLIHWHRQRKAVAEIGDDPAAYRKKLEEELRTQLLAELKMGTVAPNGQARAPQSQQRFPGSLAAASQAGDQGAHLDQGAIGAVFASDRKRK